MKVPWLTPQTTLILGPLEPVKLKLWVLQDNIGFSVCETRFHFLQIPCSILFNVVNGIHMTGSAPSGSFYYLELFVDVDDVKFMNIFGPTR